MVVGSSHSATEGGQGNVQKHARSTAYIQRSRAIATFHDSATAVGKVADLFFVPRVDGLSRLSRKRT